MEKSENASKGQTSNNSRNRRPPSSGGPGSSSSERSQDPSARNSQLRSEDQAVKTQPSTSTVDVSSGVAPRSQSQKRKDRRRAAAERRANTDSPAADAPNEHVSPSDHDSSPPESAPASSNGKARQPKGKPQEKPVSARDGPKPAKNSAPISTATSASGSHSGPSSHSRNARHQDIQQQMKEDVAVATSTSKKVKNLTGFGASQPNRGSSAREQLLASAEYVPSHARSDNDGGDLLRSSQNSNKKGSAKGPKVHTLDHSHHDHASHVERLDLSSAIEGQTEMATKIIQELVGNRYECDICFNTIRRSVATWTCGHCYSIFHIVCAKKWAKSAMESAAALSGSTLSSQPAAHGHSHGSNDRSRNGQHSASHDHASHPSLQRWNCPKCRHGHEGVPNSWCFCGKVKNPANDPMKVPHSCGEPCLRRKVGTNCPHLCPLQCHPGPCPPCASMAPVQNCFCGRATYRLRCGQPDNGQSCGSKCAKILNCGRHTCEATCHAGACGKCTCEVEQTCYCGKNTEKRICGAEDEKENSEGRFFSCHNKCERTLDCGKHQCERTCHFNACEPCALTPERVSHCGCGKVDIKVLLPNAPRKSCLDPIPTCGNICGKMRLCGHRCKAMCHPGECPDCEEKVEIPCRCHTSSKTMICSEVKVSVADETKNFVCERACGRTKACGKHVCAIRCCPSYHDTTDPEGNHVCRVTCNKKLKCGKHNCKQPCHKGRCDRCLEAVFHDIVCPCGKTIQEAPIVCGTPALVCPHPCSKRRDCGHPANTHSCHEGPCPPCVLPVETPCAGGHTVMLNIPCYKREMSCGVVCNKPMACGLHNCKQICHTGPCEQVNVAEASSASHNAPDASDSESSKQNRPSCGQACKARLWSCEHLCPAPCHPGLPCPEEVCTQMSRVTCSCGVNAVDMPCPGKTKPVLPCNNACESARRKRQIAEAFGIYGTATSAPRYPDLLLNMACVAPLFISRVEKWLDDFVKTSATVTRQELPPLDRVQRQCVHELAKFYGVGTESQGSEDRKSRAVTLTRRRDSKSPSVPLTVVANITGIFDNKSTTSDEVLKEPSVLETAPSSTLHIYDLHKGILTNTLHSFLSGYANEYTLQWIDDENCLAIFSDPMRMQRALNSLQPRGTFKVKPYQDVLPDSFGSGLVSLGSSTTSSVWGSAPSNSSNSAWSSPSAASSIMAPKVKVTNDGSYKPQSVWNRGPPSGSPGPYSPSNTPSPNNTHTGSNMWDVLGVAEQPASGVPSLLGPAGSSSTVVSQNSLMMWNYGEDESKTKKGDSASSAPSAPSVSSTAQSSSNDNVDSAAEKAPSTQQTHVVNDWMELADDDEETPSAPASSN